MKLVKYDFDFAQCCFKQNDMSNKGKQKVFIDLFSGVQSWDKEANNYLCDDFRYKEVDNRIFLVELGFDECNGKTTSQRLFLNLRDGRISIITDISKKNIFYKEYSIYNCHDFFKKFLLKVLLSNFEKYLNIVNELLKCWNLHFFDVSMMETVLLDLHADFKKYLSEHLKNDVIKYDNLSDFVVDEKLSESEKKDIIFDFCRDNVNVFSLRYDQQIFFRVHEKRLLCSNIVNERKKICIDYIRYH